MTGGAPKMTRLPAPSPSANTKKRERIPRPGQLFIGLNRSMYEYDIAQNQTTRYIYSDENGSRIHLCLCIDGVNLQRKRVIHTHSPNDTGKDECSIISYELSTGKYYKIYSFMDGTHWIDRNAAFEILTQPIEELNQAEPAKNV